MKKNIDINIMFGFTRGRGTADAMFMLRQLPKKSSAKKDM